MFAHQLSYDNSATFKQHALDKYFIDHVHQDPDLLFISFDSMIPEHHTNPQIRYPFAGKLLIEKGYSVIGIKALEPNWYRHPEIIEFMQNQKLRSLVSSYKRIILFGESMGGYAALAFSDLFPNSEILCYGPQSTLNKKLVPWDNRFNKLGARLESWDGPFNDAAKELKHAKKIYALYDPFFPDDMKHIERLPQNKIVKLKAPNLGHQLSPHLLTLGVLKEIPIKLVENKLEAWFPQKIRTRKNYHIYKSFLYYNLARRAVFRKHISQAIHYCEHALKFNIKNEAALALAKMLIEKQKTGRVDLKKLI